MDTSMASSSAILTFLWHQVIAVAAVVGFTVTVTFLVAAAIKATIGLRVSETVQEDIGLGAAFDWVPRLWTRPPRDASRRHTNAKPIR